MNDICGINRITPFQGFHIRGDSFRRALPHATDYWAFSPLCDEKMKYHWVLDENDMCRKKAESLTINSIGQRSMKRNTHANPKPQRGVINLINQITPFQGLPFRDDLFRRALPYAIDKWAFSPIDTNKAESLTINSIGQRPMERNTHVNPKPQRGVINLIIK